MKRSKQIDRILAAVYRESKFLGCWLEQAVRLQVDIGGLTGFYRDEAVADVANEGTLRRISKIIKMPVFLVAPSKTVSTQAAK